MWIFFFFFFFLIYREIGTTFVVVICWIYLTDVLVDMAYKHYASKEVFCGIRFQTKMKIWILSKNSRVKSNNGILLLAAVKLVNRRILEDYQKEPLLDFAYWIGWIWVDYWASVFSEVIRKCKILWWFQGGAELNLFASTRLILADQSRNDF